jgi:hypothetical protein
MAGNWDTYDAEQMLAQRKFAEESGPCPACDGEAYVEAIDISCFGGFNNFLPGKNVLRRRMLDRRPGAVHRIGQADSSRSAALSHTDSEYNHTPHVRGDQSVTEVNEPVCLICGAAERLGWAQTCEPCWDNQPEIDWAKHDAYCYKGICPHPFGPPTEVEIAAQSAAEVRQ